MRRPRHWRIAGTNGHQQHEQATAQMSARRVV
jgi:hypothetical protein